VKKVIAFFSMVLFLCACGEPEIKGPEHWSNAQENYICTKEQWGLAESQAKFCYSVNYSGGYCLGTAIVRNCKFNKEKTK
jgi:hypothetical protein